MVIVHGGGGAKNEHNRTKNKALGIICKIYKCVNRIKHFSN